MEIPPRTKDNHLITGKLMFNAYAAVGIMETISAYISFFLYTSRYGNKTLLIFIKGFTRFQFVGTGGDFNTPYDQLSPDRQNFYDQMCLITKEYTGVCGANNMNG